MVVPKRQTAARDVVRLIAARQQSRADEISGRIFASLREEIPEYGAINDDPLIQDVRSVSAAGVVLWLEQLRTGRVPREQDFEPVREGARRRARQGFDHYALLRAWRIAIRVMWTELIQEPAALEPDVRQVLPDVAEEAMNFSDQISLAVTDAYLLEAGRVAREHERRRSLLLELILSRPDEAALSPTPAELAQPHVVVVVETEDLPLDGLDAVGAKLERLAGAALWTVRSHAVVAAVPLRPNMRRTQSVTHLRSVFQRLGQVDAMGVGGDACNIDGSRHSYLEAVEALKYGRRLGVSGPVYDFSDVGSYSLMLRDPERARRFVSAALAPLGGFKLRWLEPTLEAYIARQGRIKEAATELGVHPNTVKYRLGEIREPLNIVLRDPHRRAELLTALRLRRLLDA
ncbi:MAG: PucR family transcriptional regulator, partial [Candidatus Dormibacteraceae bacterium]